MSRVEMTLAFAMNASIAAINAGVYVESGDGWNLGVAVFGGLVSIFFACQQAKP